MRINNQATKICSNQTNRHFTSYRLCSVVTYLSFALFLIGCATPKHEDFPENFQVVNTSKPKNIFVFMDGTSNNSRVPTNIYRLFEEIKKNKDNQTVARYIEGVGNAENPLDSTLGIAGAFGMEDRILQGYEFITEHYQPKSETYQGDRIYIFGFSRGAHTARSLAGLISYAGIPKVSDAEIKENVLIDIGNDILELTKDRLDSGHADDWKNWQPEAKPILTELIRNNEIIGEKGRELQSAEVEFLGVWDTVPGSLFKDRIFGTYDDLVCKESIGGIKSTWGVKHIAHLLGITYGERYKIDSYPAIKHIAHAVSKDEKRSMFMPLPLCSKAITPSSVFDEKNTELIEVAFPGAHADVGGGYEDKNNQLPDISLNWMLGLLSNYYTLSSETQNHINATNTDLKGLEHLSKGLAHLSIADPDGNTFSSCLDRNLPNSIESHKSILYREMAGAVPWLVVEKNSSSSNHDKSCLNFVKPIEGVSQENIECIRQININCADLSK